MEPAVTKVLNQGEQIPDERRSCIEQSDGAARGTLIDRESKIKETLEETVPV